MRRHRILAPVSTILTGVTILLVGLWALNSSGGPPEMVVYGKVIDQAGNPVAGACLQFNASLTTSIYPAFYEGNQRRWSVGATAGDDGLFKIDAGKGNILFAQMVTRSGYQQASLAGPFNFSAAYNSPIYHPDPTAPVIFMMWNARLRRVVHKTIAAPIHSSTYTVLYVGGDIDNGRTFDDLVLTIGYATLPPSGPYDWMLTVEGGHERSVAACDGPLKNIAPTVGYVPKLVWKMNAVDPKWSSKMTKRFYTKRDDGKIYAAVELIIDLDAPNHTQAATIKYTASFDGSPDLTPGPALPQK